MNTPRAVQDVCAWHIGIVDHVHALCLDVLWHGANIRATKVMRMHDKLSSQGSSARQVYAVALVVAALTLGACHDRNPTTQQPYGPTVPSTSPTSTTPRQPASSQTILSPAKPASTTPTVPSSRSSS